MTEWRETGRGVVLPWMCDHFGHMNVRHYASDFDDASFHIWSLAGVTVDDFERHGCVTVVASTRIKFLRELPVGRLFLIQSGIIKIGTKSVTFQQKMTDANTDILHAVNEVVEVFFDSTARASMPIPDDIRDRIAGNLVDPEAQ